MPTPVRVAAFPMILLAALTACGGGGGGGGNTIRDVPFTSFSAIGGNERVTISGLSQTATATNTGSFVDAFSPNPLNESNSAMALTYDRNRNLSGISIATPQSSVSYGAGDIDCSSATACGAVSPDLSSIAVVMNPFSPSIGWNYQTFGVWLKDVTPTSFQAGAISVGAVTPVSGLPLGLTSAAFFGHAGGFYNNGTGSLFITDAEMTATVNFQTRFMTFTTSSTLLTDPFTFATTPNSNLNLHGTWTYAEGISHFSGTVTNASSMSGNLTGQFFGPSAEEIGGVYSLTGSGNNQSMIGAFGGKRP